MVAVSAGLVGLTLGLIYLQTSATHVDNLQLSDVLWKVFFALSIIIQNGLLEAFTADSRRLRLGAIETACSMPSLAAK